MGGYDLERYLNLRQATASFGHESDRLAFHHDTTGINRVDARWARGLARP